MNQTHTNVFDTVHFPMNKDFHDCIITHDISCMIYMYMCVIYFPVHVDLPDLKYMYRDTGMFTFILF